MRRKAWHMLETNFPRQIRRPKLHRSSRTCAAHRAWVRRHHCSVPACLLVPVECAHVRGSTNGGVALKPSDRWVISLCFEHHSEQHRIGESHFEQKYSICLT